MFRDVTIRTLSFIMIMRKFISQDVDCMPLNPMENMPEALRKHNIAVDKFSLTSKDLQINGNLNFGGPVMFTSGGHAEKAPSPMNVFVKHGQVRIPTIVNLNSLLPMQNHAQLTKICVVFIVHVYIYINTQKSPIRTSRW